jgi:hypothetical protein
VPATGLFGIGAPTLAGITGVDGSGVVFPGVTGRAAWRIFPTSEAAPDGPTPYFVGGTLSYREGNSFVNVPLAPAAITVLPNALLRLDYFHQRDVYSDDPSTEVIEPAVPFSLGVLARNVGRGVARNVRITSAQPEIVDNLRGLLVDFDLIGTQVGRQPISPSLTVDFGNLGPGELASGRWLLTSTLQGLFIDYSATFEHIDALGDPRLSLIESVDIHEMIRVVQAVGATNDGLPDFLVNDVPDANDLPDTLHGSDGGVAPVSVVRQAAISTTTSSTGLVAQLSATLPAGWFYLRVPDPGNGRYRLLQVLRGDGVELPPENFWLTDRTFIGGGQPPVPEKLLHLFDSAGTNTYTLFYSSTNDVVPPATRVAVLPAESYPAIPLSWTGEDNVNGTGLAYFDIFVSVNGGSFTLWLAQTRAGGAIYHGGLGTNYAFYSVGTDYAGNREPAPGTPDAQTRVTLTNRAPVLAPIANGTTNEGAVFVKQAVATDPDGPGQTLTYRLRTAPAGATIDPVSGLITWATGEGHGDSDNLFVVEVRDNGIPTRGDATSFRVFVSDLNLPPTWAPLPPIAVNVGETLVLTNRAFDPDLPAQSLIFVLDTNVSPAGVRLTNYTAGEAVLRWSPTPEHASTTRTLRVVVWDDGNPRLSATQDVVVVVNDFLAVGLGRTNVLAGDSGGVPLTVFSSAGVSDVCFTLEVPAGRLTNLVLSSLGPRVCNIAVTELNPTRLRFCLQTCAGQTLLGTEEIAWLSFTALSNRSSFVPLVVRDASAVRTDGEAIPRVAARDGRVTVIGEEPLLEMTQGTNGSVWLTLFGQPQRDYQILHSADLGRPRPWEPFARLHLEGLSETMRLMDVSGRSTFFDALAIPAEEQQPRLQLRQTSGRTAELILRGAPGETYAIESTRDLTGASGWTPVQTLTLGEGVAVLLGINTTERAVFYRAVRQR